MKINLDYEKLSVILESQSALDAFNLGKLVSKVKAIQKDNILDENCETIRLSVPVSYLIAEIINGETK